MYSLQEVVDSADIIGQMQTVYKINSIKLSFESENVIGR